MRKPLRIVGVLCMAIALALGVFALAGCSSSSSSPQQESQQSAAIKQVTDVTGRVVDVPAEPQKIVGIGASSLRVICYLGEQDKVVGVEVSEQEDAVTCTYRHVNVESFKNLPVIGEGGAKGVTPNEEALINAAPDVIIASVDKDTADSLQAKTKIPVVCIEFNDKVFDQDIYDNITLAGAVLGAEKRADEIVSYMKDAQADLAKRVEGQPSHTAYAAGVSFRGGHGFAGTEAGFAPFNSVNLTNIVDGEGASGCFDIDLEKVTSAQPECIFVDTSNLGLVKEDIANNPDYFKNLTAVQSGNVHSLVSYRYYQTNLDLALANCYAVGAAAYPEQFSDIDPTAKLGEITQFFLGKDISADLAAEGYSFGKVDLLS